MSLEADRSIFDSKWQRAAKRARALGAQFREGSGFRTLGENLASGGAHHSQHLVGLAKDFPVASWEDPAAKILRRELEHEGLQVITEPHGTGPHVHAQLYRGGEVPAAYFPRAEHGQREPVIPVNAPPRRSAWGGWAARPARF